MKWNDFTNWLRKSSAEYESQVDVQKLWSGMEAEVDALNSKGNLRNTLLTLVIAGILLTGGTVAYLSMNSGGETASNVPIQPETEFAETQTKDYENQLMETGEVSEQIISEAREEAMKDQFRINDVSSRDLSDASSLAKDNMNLSNRLKFQNTMPASTALKAAGSLSTEDDSEMDETRDPNRMEEDLQVSEILNDQHAAASENESNLNEVSQAEMYDRIEEEDKDVVLHTPEQIQSEREIEVQQEVTVFSDESVKSEDVAMEEINSTIVEQGREVVEGKISHENPDQIADDAAAEVFSPVSFPQGDKNIDVGEDSEDELAMASHSDAAEIKTASLESVKPIAGKKKRNLCPNIGNYKGKKWTYLAGVEAGAAYPFRKMTSSGLDADALFTFRSERETSMAKINYGFAFTAIHPSGFYLSSGFGFSNLLERYEFTGTKTETEMVYGVVSIAINPLGDTTYTMGDIPVTTTTQVNKKIYNKYNYFEIPVLVGYQRQIENWSFGVQGGVNLGLITSAVGEISDENGNEVSIFDMKDELFSSKFSANYYLGAKVSYNTRGGLSIYVSPNVRFDPHDATSASYPVTSKYIFVGGSLGVAYQFGR